MKHSDLGSMTVKGENTDPSRAPRYRGKARDLGITYFSRGGAPMPEWAEKGKRPPKGIYPGLDEAGSTA